MDHAVHYKLQKLCPTHTHAHVANPRPNLPVTPSSSFRHRHQSTISDVTDGRQHQLSWLEKYRNNIHTSGDFGCRREEADGSTSFPWSSGSTSVATWPWNGGAASLFAYHNANGAGAGKRFATALVYLFAKSPRKTFGHSKRCPETDLRIFCGADADVARLVHGTATVLSLVVD